MGANTAGDAGPRHRLSTRRRNSTPFDVAYLPAAPFITSIDYQPVSLEAMAQALFGEINPSGMLPVTVTEPPPGTGVLYTLGCGIGFP